MRSSLGTLLPALNVTVAASSSLFPFISTLNLHNLPLAAQFVKVSVKSCHSNCDRPLLKSILVLLVRLPVAYVTSVFACMFASGIVFPLKSFDELVFAVSSCKAVISVLAVAKLFFIVLNYL